MRRPALTRGRWLLAAASLAIVTAVGAWGLRASDRSVSQVTSEVTSSAVATTPGATGMRLYRDPETGELTTPTAEQAAELEKSTAGLDWSDQGLEIVTHPDGRKSMHLEGRFRNYSVVHVGPDGKLHTDCVEGACAAERTFNTPLPSSSNGGVTLQ